MQINPQDPQLAARTLQAMIESARQFGEHQGVDVTPLVEELTLLAAAAASYDKEMAERADSAEVPFGGLRLGPAEFKKGFDRLASWSPYGSPRRITLSRLSSFAGGVVRRVEPHPDGNWKDLFYLLRAAARREGAPDHFVKDASLISARGGY